MSISRKLMGGTFLAAVVVAESLAWAQEVEPVGNSEGDRKRNAEMLRGFDYSKYPSAITGYTGQDRQQIVFERRQHAMRKRVGPKGNYKGTVAELPGGKLVLVTCRNNNDADPTKKQWELFAYESSDGGLTWTELGKTPIAGKEPCLTALSDGTLVLFSQRGYFGPGSKDREEINLARSSDGGRTWETESFPGNDYPRNLIVEKDGSLLMIRALKFDWHGKGDGSPNLQLCRSKDGKNWTFSEGEVDWDRSAFGEVSSLRLKDGRLMAALRCQIPGTKGEGFQNTAMTFSSDDGKNWSKPRVVSNTAEVHFYLRQLKDGRILATYSNYHLPYGAYAIVSGDNGKTWDLDHPIRLAASADLYVGWPVTIQLGDESLMTAYAITAYLNQPPNRFATEVVRWRLP